MFIITLPSEAIARGIREFSPSIGMEALLVGIATFKTFRRLMVGLSASPFFFLFFCWQYSSSFKSPFSFFD